jgi:valine--pyruvate aminotransferase
MKVSSFGEKLTQKTGILELMDDLGRAMSTDRHLLLLGGGNPARIPEIDKIWRQRWQEIANNGDELERMLGNYTTPQGDGEFIKTVVDFFKRNYQWQITPQNVTILGGSQTTFFFLFNMLAGKFPDNTKKKILLPLAPEYIGYADQGIAADMFVSYQPTIDYLDDHTFKYHIDFENLQMTDVGAICVSRPTNPTGNVLTDDEVAKLHTLAKEHNVPLIIDNAYGTPFPNILFTEIKPFWDDQVIYVLTLSKIGLPSIRTSIVIANEEITEKLTSINAIVSLSTGTVGQHLVMPYLANDEILEVGTNIIRPFYQKKAQVAITLFHQYMQGSNVPYYLHKSEGALFLWLWCKDLPITSYELYQRLKKRGVIVVPGQYFFPGLQSEWRQKDECLRITYSQDDEMVRKGLQILAEEIKKAYA